MQTPESSRLVWLECSVSELPGSALRHAQQSMADTRDLLVKLFGLDEAEATQRVTHKVEDLQVSLGNPDWLLDPDTVAIIFRDGP